MVDALKAGLVVAVVVAAGAAAAVWTQMPQDTGPTEAPGDGDGSTTNEDPGGQGNATADSGSMLVALEEVDKPREILEFPVFGPDGTRVGNASWRVVQETGNCCENYVTTTSRGRIVDLGGTFPFSSLDDGRSWVRVTPQTPFVNGEGAVAVAPNGDILAVMWDPYSGDRLVAFKWSAADATWDYAETPLKTPFFDRPWLSVIPGPIEGPTETADYVVYLRGGWPSKEVGYVSYDGLHYIEATSPAVETRTGDTVTLDEVPKDAAADWTQPHSESGVTPLPQGGAVVQQMLGPADCRWKHVSTEMTWSCLSVPGLEEGRLVVDSRGRLHNVDVDGSTVTYRITSDGGESWSKATRQVPSRYDVEDWDFKVHAGLGDALVALHTHDTRADTDQDIVLRFDVANDTAALTHRYHVGAGDLDASAGAGNQNRFDFTTMGFLPDGRFVVSFTDQAHHPPSLAVLVDGP